MKKRSIYIIISFALLFIGYLLGRLHEDVKGRESTTEIIKYVPSPYAVHDTLYKDKLIPVKTYLCDTLIQYFAQEIDTAQILHDYLLTRRYNLDFSTDSTGVFMVDAEVQMNQLVSAVSTIQPIYKEIYRETKTEIYKVPTLQFWATIGTSPKLDYNSITLGIDLKQKYLLGVSGVRWDDKYNFAINAGIKF